jgi:hypothetical protein
MMNMFKARAPALRAQRHPLQKMRVWPSAVGFHPGPLPGASRSDTSTGEEISAEIRDAYAGSPPLFPVFERRPTLLTLGDEFAHRDGASDRGDEPSSGPPSGHLLPHASLGVASQNREEREVATTSAVGEACYVLPGWSKQPGMTGEQTGEEQVAIAAWAAVRAEVLGLDLHAGSSACDAEPPVEPSPAPVAEACWLPAQDPNAWLEAADASGDAARQEFENRACNVLHEVNGRLAAPHQPPCDVQTRPPPLETPSSRGAYSQRGLKGDRRCPEKGRD